MTGMILPQSLSKLFNFFDADFRCHVYLNNDDGIEITNELKYENIETQFEWNFPEFLEKHRSGIFKQVGNPRKNCLG